MTMGLRITIVILLLGVAPARSEDAGAIHAREIASCKDKLFSGQFRTRTAFARCNNAANVKGWNGDRDLLDYAVARELVAAQKFDEGGMSEEEYAAERAKIKSELITSMQTREANTAAMERPRVIVSPPQKTFWSCYTSGSGRTTNCF